MDLITFFFRYAIEVAIGACFQESFQCINKEDIKAIGDLLNQLKLLADIDDKVVQSSDCSFLYFNKDLYPILVKYLYVRTEYHEAERMQLIMSAFSDASQMLRTSSYFDTDFYLKQYREYVIEKILYRDFIVPLCFEIESSLRLLLFAKNVNELKPINPKEQKQGQYRKYVEMPPLQICGVTMYTKRVIERYLERSFYNFSTLHDSKTYAEMAILAREIYGLSLIKNNLPRENVQDIDFIDILDIDVFCKKYNYNMVQQNFVERKSNDGCKYLKTLGIETISSSFQRHGLGIAKNLINAAEQCLLRNFQKLSQIFSDNLFRSLLSKESRWLEQGNTTYSLDRAMTLRREISKSGASEGDTSIAYLEECRELISMIGNTLGLARLIHSGKMYSMNQSRKYFSIQSCHQDEEDQEGFLHQITSRLKTSTALNDFGVDLALLQNFYILFPALSLTWLDTSMRGKDMLNKKFQTFDAYYTDDGFAMGSAFILEVINQSTGLDRLNWFESCCVAFALNRKQILENLKKEIQNQNMTVKKDKSSLIFGSKSESGIGNNADNNIDNELSRMRVLSKRLEMRKQEMELLQYSVLGARVFFACPSDN